MEHTNLKKMESFKKNQVNQLAGLYGMNERDDWLL